MAAGEAFHSLAFPKTSSTPPVKKACAFLLSDTSTVTLHSGWIAGDEMRLHRFSAGFPGVSEEQAQAVLERAADHLPPVH
jgi:hypothetical protein